MHDIKKIQLIATELMGQVSIDEDHNYTRNSDGKGLAGSTRITGTFPKDWAIPFGAKEAVRHFGYFDEVIEEGEVQVEHNKAGWLNLETLFAKIKLMSSYEFFNYLIDAKKRPKQKADTAKDLGTSGHDYLELYVKSKIRGTETPVIPNSLFPIKLISIAKYINHFIEWEKENVAQWVLSEARVCDAEPIKEGDEVHEYCGTLDALAVMKDGSLAIIDFKFSAHISYEYFMQTASYQFPFERRGVHIDKRIIIRIPKEDWLVEYDEVLHKYRKIPNILEVLEVWTPYEFDIDCFLNARKVARHLNFIKDCEAQRKREARNFKSGKKIINIG